MSNHAFIVTNQGNTLLEADEAWYKYCKKNGIKNPFFNISETTKVERDAYRRWRDRWIVEWLMINKGYEAAAHCVWLRDDDVNDLWWWFENILPCECNSDCNIFCKNFENCLREGF